METEQERSRFCRADGQVWVLAVSHQAALRLLALPGRGSKALSWDIPALPHPHFLNSDLFVKSYLQLVPALSAEQKAVLKAKEPIKSMHRGKSNTMKKT